MDVVGWVVHRIPGPLVSIVNGNQCLCDGGWGDVECLEGGRDTPQGHLATLYY